MSKLISLPIRYHDREYQSLIRFTKKEDYTQLRVTIMNGELERMLYGRNVFEVRNGCLVCAIHQNGKTTELDKEVRDVLIKYLAESDEYRTVDL